MKHPIKIKPVYIIILPILIVIIYFQGYAAKAVYLMTIQSLRDTNRRVEYVKEAGEKEEIVQKLVENVGKSMMYYCYVKEKSKENRLVIYDPNIRKLTEYDDEPVDENSEISSKGAENTKVKNNGEDKVNLAEDKEGKDTKEVTLADGILTDKLEKMGVGELYTMEQLSDFDFLTSNFYVIPQRASVLPEELSPKELLAMDMSIKMDNTKPQILIYHTHSMECFADSEEGDISTSIVAVGSRLAELLSDKYGYNVIHCTERFDYVDGVMDRSKAYTYAREALAKILEDNPSIQVVLDIHRDGVDENVHLKTEIDGVNMAQIMFFNGVSRTKDGGDIDYLYNKYKKQNLAFSMQMKLLAEKKYPGYTRHNYIDAYQYNLDLRERSALIEVGAQNNTFTEEVNAMEPLAALLNSILSGSDEI